MANKPQFNGDRMAFLTEQLLGLQKTVNEDVVPTLSRVEAVLIESKKRAEEEIKALFAGRREHEGRISQIERDYRSQAACDKRHDENREDHEKMDKSISGLNVSVTRLLTIASLMAAAVSGGIQVVVYFFSHRTMP